MSNALEIAANVFNAASIVLAGRNSIHMWWTTLVGCVLFVAVFYWRNHPVCEPVFVHAAHLLPEGTRAWLL